MTAATAPALDFETIYNTHYRRVFSICLKMLHNIEDAEDLAQDTFIQVQRSMSSYRGDSTFTTWLHRVTVNQVLMFMRQRKQKHIANQISLDDPDESNLTLNMHSRPRPIVESMTLEAAINQLPKGYKETLLLHDLEGFEHEQVAQIMGVAVGTSKSQLSKARIKIRKLINRKVNPRIYQKAQL